MNYDLNVFDTDTLFELYYELQKEKDKDAVLSKGLWHESLTEKDSIFKSQSVNTDKEELEIRIILKEALRNSEKNTLKNLYNADKKQLKLLHLTFKDIKIEDRKKEVFNGLYTYTKSTLPVFVKEINSISVDLIATFDAAKTNKELLLAILGAGQEGIARAYRDAGLKNPWVLSTSKFANIYKARAEKFTEAVSDNVQSRIRTEITNGIKEGLGTDQIADKIKEAYKKPIEVIVNEGKKNESIRYLDNDYWANMVARTETSWASNQGRLDAYQESGLVKTVRGISAADPCEDCLAEITGKIFTLDEAQDLIPLHPHCRCSYVVEEYQERNVETSIQNSFVKYGTSEGAIAGWDVRGRGQKTEPQKTERTRNEQLQSNSMKESAKQIQEDIGLSESDAYITLDAIRYYTSTGYISLRAQQNGSTDILHGDDIEYLRSVADKERLIEQYISLAPKYTEEIQRGVTGRQFEKQILEGNIKPGDIVDMRGTSSWTSGGLKQAEEFGNVIFRTRNSKMATAISHLSDISRENEVIVSKLARFKVSNVKILKDSYKLTKPFESTNLIIIDVEPINTVTKSLDIEKKKSISEIKEREESDRYITIRRDGKIIYHYTGQTDSSKKNSDRIMNGLFYKYGTSEGASRGWDTRGRGQKQTTKIEEKRGAQVAVGVIKTSDKDYVLTTDGEKLRNYVDKVKEMKEVADRLHEVRFNPETGNDHATIRNLDNELMKLDTERSHMHNALAETTAKAFKEEHPEYKGSHVNLVNTIREEIATMTDKIISHIGKSIEMKTQDKTTKDI